jgi:hypothetical protein
MSFFDVEHEVKKDSFFVSAGIDIFLKNNVHNNFFRNLTSKSSRSIFSLPRQSRVNIHLTKDPCFSPQSSGFGLWNRVSGFVRQKEFALFLLRPSFSLFCACFSSRSHSIFLFRVCESKSGVAHVYICSMHLVTFC